MPLNGNMNIKLELNKHQLQLIAIAAMTLDHIAWLLAGGYSYEWWVLLFHMAGRITAPIMWFFAAEGYSKTHNLRKYAGRLLVFALISHFAYNFFLGNSFIPFEDSVFEQTSVLWSLFEGVMGIYIIEKDDLKKWHKAVLTALLCILSFSADWSCISVLAIVWIHLNRKNTARQLAGIEALAVLSGLGMLFLMDKVYALLQLCVCFSFPLIMAYNGKKGAGSPGRYFFYIYYPAHLLLLAFIRITLL